MQKCFGICLTVLVLAGTVQAASLGRTVSTETEFQTFRSKPSMRCSENVGTGNLDDRLLNTDAKKMAFRNKLNSMEQTYFDKLLSSADHSVDTFTGDQLLQPIQEAVKNLDTTQQDIFMNIRSKWGSISYDDLTSFLKAIKPVDMLMVKKDLMTELTGKLDEPAIEVMCERVTNDSVTNSEMAIAFIDRHPDCVALAWKKRAEDSAKQFMSGAKGSFMYEKLAQTMPANQWDVNTLLLAPDAVSAEDVNNVADSHYCDNAQREKLADKEFISMVSEEVRKAVARKMSKCSDLSSMGSWDSDKIKKFSVYLASMPKTELKNMDVGKVIDSMEDLLKMDKKDAEAIFKSTASKLMLYWSKNPMLPNDKKTKMLCIMAKYAPVDSFFKTVKMSDLQAFMTNKGTLCPGMEFDNGELSEISKRILSDPTFSKDFSKLGNDISSLPTSSLKSLDAADICSATNIESLKKGHFKMHDLKLMYSKCKTTTNYDFATLTCDQLKAMGEFVKALTLDDIGKIPADTLIGCIQDIGSSLNDICASNKGLCRAIWNRMKTKSGLDMGDMMKKMSTCPELMKMMDLKDAETVDIQQLGGMEDAAKYFDGSRKMAAAMVKSMKQHYGDVTDTNTNYTGQEFKKAVSLFVMGGKNEDIRKLPEDSTFVDGLKEVNVESLPQKKRIVVKEKLSKVYGFDNNRDVCVEPAITETTSPFFGDASAKMMSNLQSKSLRGMFKGLGKDFSVLKDNTRAQMKVMTDVMFDVDGMRGKSVLTMDDVAKYGPYMFCGADKDMVKKFDWDVIDAFMEDFAQCASVHMDRETKQAFVDHVSDMAKSKSLKLSEDSEFLQSMGSLIYQYMPTLKTDLQAMTKEQKENFASATRDIFEGLSKDMQEKEKRNSKEVPQAEKDQDKNDLKELAGLMLQAKRDSQAKRKRRATDPLTCTDIQAYNGELAFLTATQVSDIDSGEFVDCLSEFQKTQFAADVLSALGDKLKQGYGSNTTAWTNDQIIAAGKLLDALTDDDINNLPMDDEIAAGIAQHIFSAKKETLLARYLSATSTAASALTSTHLSTLGNLTCGFTDSHINDLDATAVSDAAADLGGVLCYTQAQISGLGQKIADKRGSDWTAVDPAVVAELGILAGGLPQNVLEDFGEDHISSMTKQAVAAIPTSIFPNIFTATRIGYLSPEQANEVTDAQKATLSQELQNQLSALSTIYVDSYFNNNGVVHTASIFLMTVLTVGWMLFDN